MAISLVQSKAGGSASVTGPATVTATTNSVGFSTPTTPGSLLVCIGYSTCSSPTVSPGAPAFNLPSTPGFTWTPISGGPWGQGLPSTGGRVGLWYIPNAASMSSATSLTASIVGIGFTVTVNVEFELYEFSGVAASSPIDVTGFSSNQAGGSPQAPVGGSITTSATDLVIVAFSGNSANISAGAGYTLGINATVATTGQTQYQLNVPAGAVSTAFTGTQTNWGAIVASFSASTAATGQIIVKKVTFPSGNPQVFSFTPNYEAPFALTDGQSNVSGPLSPVSGLSTIALVQHNNLSTTTAATMRTATGNYAVGTNAGSLLILMVSLSAGWNPASGAGPTPTISLPTTPGFTWTLAVSQTSAFQVSGTQAKQDVVAIYYIQNAAAMLSTAVTTVVTNVDTTNPALNISLLGFDLIEVSGAAISSVVDAIASNTALNDPPPFSAGQLTTDTGTMLLVAGFNTNSYPAGSGYTLLDTTNTFNLRMEYNLNSAAGIHFGAFGLGPVGGMWVCVAAAFKAAGTGVYAVTETPVPGWTTTTNIDPSSIPVVAGQTTTVVFTNTKNAVLTGQLLSLVPFDYDFNSDPITNYIALVYPPLAIPDPKIVFRGETLTLGHKISTRRLRLQADNAPLPTIVANAQQQAKVTMTGAGQNSVSQSPTLNMQGNAAPTGLAIQTYYGDAVLSDEMVQPSLESVFFPTTPWQTMCAFRIASASLIGIDATGTTQ